ncbi:hypothetical protein ALQ37_102664 [Pseudomonas syringae pv. aptata]|uniref:Uncharacterized protein n=1 Tax=Pseudomonas syringae pv. aptata TaxID=83167 RepID=A0A0Q0DEZ2_PSEAP|nr:hypothetical protein ALO45_102127 [Pseudomonas syringae pv. syringae]KPY99075.1 hypothetical protein ALO85_101921 [Pseudomonas syringae pv. aptata]RMO44259.1 hypothetical protein ALQ40_101869 [Pseudomonas syringae]RMO63410.1 hypothetical protein ALQ37_102664 [Pseudomonas syringae pv. aptata]RMU62176.1 hypothetical protein ALP25_102174 [Pseudomonas syringae pv. syringae]
MWRGNQKDNDGSSLGEGGCQGMTGDASAAAQRSLRSPLATRQFAQQGCCERHHQD